MTHFREKTKHRIKVTFEGMKRCEFRRHAMANGEVCMKIIIDLKLCEGNERCVNAAPEVFELRDDEKSHLLVERPPERLRAKISQAARVCPRQAISIIED